MKNKILIIEKKIKELENNSKERRVLELSKKEYQILKDSLIPKELHKYSEITNYRGILIKVKKRE